MNTAISFNEAVDNLVEARNNALEHLRNLIQSTEVAIENRNPVRREAVRRLLIEAFKTRNAWVRGIADDMGYNFTSVSRWASGASCPHEALWPQVIEWFHGQLDMEIGPRPLETIP